MAYAVLPHNSPLTSSLFIWTTLTEHHPIPRLRVIFSLRRRTRRHVQKENSSQPPPTPSFSARLPPLKQVSCNNDPFETHRVGGIRLCSNWMTGHGWIGKAPRWNTSLPVVPAVAVLPVFGVRARQGFVGFLLLFHGGVCEGTEIGVKGPTCRQKT